LVFFYSSLSHVGLYVGNGMMIHAPHTGDVVKYSSIFSEGSPMYAGRVNA
jgi:cell wall-associated NlpC family hydrolase